MKYHHRRQGFTIVEMLVVIVVIGILATISIVTFNGVRDRASVARKEADINNIVKSAEIYRASSSDQSFPSSFNTNFVSELNVGSGIGDRITRGDDQRGGSVLRPCTASTGITKDRYCIISHRGSHTQLNIYWWNDVKKIWIHEMREYENGTSNTHTKELSNSNIPEIRSGPDIPQ